MPFTSQPKDPEFTQQTALLLDLVDICKSRLHYSINTNRLLLRYHKHLNVVFNNHLDSIEFAEAVTRFL